jgi:glutaredoxin
MKNKVFTLYTVPNCFHCRDVKRGLDKNGVKYVEVVCDSDKLTWLSQRTSRLITPVMLDENNKEVYWEDLIK